METPELKGTLLHYQAEKECGMNSISYHYVSSPQKEVVTSGFPLRRVSTSEDLDKHLWLCSFKFLKYY